MVKDKRKSLGGGEEDDEEIKSNKLLSGKDWNDMENKDLNEKFIKRIKNQLDVRKFYDEFKRMINDD
jgi:hypothetical protein